MIADSFGANDAQYDVTEIKEELKTVLGENECRYLPSMYTAMLCGGELYIKNMKSRKYMSCCVCM
jgi:hypothetical protein